MVTEEVGTVDRRYSGIMETVTVGVDAADIQLKEG